MAHIQAISWIYKHEVETCVFPRHEVRRLFFVDDPQRVADELQRAGAWIATDNGYLIEHHRDFIVARLRARQSKRRRERGAAKAARTAAYRTLKAAIQRGECHCAACGSTDRLQVDHILPRAKGGDESPENLQVLCLPCNSSKCASDWQTWSDSR